MSFLDHLNETTMNLDELFDSTTQVAEVEFLEESIKSFADLPNAWKKVFARWDKFAGENSEIEIKSTGILKNKTAYNKLFKESLKDTTDNAGIIIEVDGLAVLALINNYEKKFNLLSNDGNLKKILRTQWDRGTLHRSGGLRKWHSGDLKVQETFDQITQTLTNLAIDKTNSNIEDESKFVKTMTIDDVISTLDITVKVVKRDRKRIEKNVERSNDRNDRNFGNKDSLAANRRAVIKKYTKENIADLVNDIKDSLPKIDEVEDILMQAAEGKDVNIDVKGLKEKVDSLNSILFAFKQAYKKGKIKSDWKNELDWDMKYLSNIIKNNKE